MKAEIIESEFEYPILMVGNVTGSIVVFIKEYTCIALVDKGGTYPNIIYDDGNQSDYRPFTGKLILSND
jgi:hypothetical protein